MSSEITDKTHVLVTRSLGNIYVTEIEANALTVTIASGKAKHVVIGGDLIMLNDVAGITSGETIRNLEKKKQGQWQCKYDRWHEKNDQCGHDGNHW